VAFRVGPMKVEGDGPAIGYVLAAYDGVIKLPRPA
jgi:hypothetical protein